MNYMLVLIGTLLFIYSCHSVPYAALCQTFEQIEDTTKRLQILDFLVKFLVSVIRLSPESLLTVIYLSINKVSVRCFIVLSRLHLFL